MIEECESENGLIECLESSEDFEVRDFNRDEDAEDGSAIEPDELQPVLEFTLIWNLFEKLVCERNAGLLFIAYRVRNNLFHGEKTIDTFHLQKELFETVNAYFSKYMSDTTLPGVGSIES